MWDFIQNQVLGMKWLNTLIHNLLNEVGVDTGALKEIGGMKNARRFAKEQRKRK